jgi:hypothetical protein
LILTIEFGYTALLLVGAACSGLTAILVRRWAAPSTAV